MQVWDVPKILDASKDMRGCDKLTSLDCKEAREVHAVFMAAAVLADRLSAPLQSGVDVLWPRAMIQHVYAWYQI